MPTRKWVAARVVSVSALLTMWVSTGSWDREESVALIGVLSAALISWLTPNQKDPA
jgi:hypothetical protein